MGNERLRARLDPDDPATLARCRVADILGASVLNRDAPLQAVRHAAPDVLTVAKTLAGDLITWLDTPLSAGPEADLCRWLAAMRGGPTPPAPTQGDLALLQVGLSPHAAFCLSATGQAPFPDGTFPPFAARRGRAGCASDRAWGHPTLADFSALLRGSLE